MPLDSIEGTLAHELADLLSAEKQFAKALQQVARSADSAEVKQMAEAHYTETLGHIENLNQAFTALGQKPERGVVCKGAQGIVEENSSTLKEEKPKGVLKDVALVSGSMRVEHYEIAGYSAAIAVAQAAGRREVVQLLQQNLKQEKATAQKLEVAGKTLLQSAKSSAAATPSASASGSSKASGSKK